MKTININFLNGNLESKEFFLKILNDTLGISEASQFLNLDLDNAIEKVLKLEFNEQVYLWHCLLDIIYLSDNFSEEITETDKKIQTFLARKEFQSHRNIILTCCDDEIPDEKKLEELSQYETKFNVKFILDK